VLNAELGLPTARSWRCEAYRAGAAVVVGFLLALASCDADRGPDTELASARSSNEMGVTTHRVLSLATETATSATDKPVEGRVLGLESTREVDVPLGNIFRVELQGTSGTGYIWNCKLPADAPLKLVGEASTRPIDRGVMGGRVLWVFTFQPQRAGMCVLTFDLARPWETGVPSVKTTSLTVSVLGSALEK